MVYIAAGVAGTARVSKWHSMAEALRAEYGPLAAAPSEILLGRQVLGE